MGRGPLDHYILDDDGEPVAVDLLTWAFWFETHHEARVVLQDTIGGIRISTVFLSLDHGWTFGDGPHTPILWETMIFGGVFDQYQRRYASRLAALQGHTRAVELVELYRTAPRKTKWALRKAHDRERAWRLGPAEVRRLEHALARIAEPQEAAA